MSNCPISLPAKLPDMATQRNSFNITQLFYVSFQSSHSLQLADLPQFVNLTENVPVKEIMS